jgi:threonine aldolase
MLSCMAPAKSCYTSFMTNLKTFASDNYSTVDPQVLDYLNEINVGHEVAYAADSVTEDAIKLFKKNFR